MTAIANVTPPLTNGNVGASENGLNPGKLTQLNAVNKLIHCCSNPPANGCYAYKTFTVFRPYSN